MTERSVVIIGLPESGKTTFLAALWHLITERDVETALKFHTLRSGETSHLNDTSPLAGVMPRFRSDGVGGNRLVSMNLKDAAETPVRITFPDVPGEAYRRMTEERDCEPEIADT